MKFLSFLTLILLTACSTQDTDIQKVRKNRTRKKETAEKLHLDLKNKTFDIGKLSNIRNHIDAEFDYSKFWNLMREDYFPYRPSQMQYFAELSPDCSSTDKRIKNKEWALAYVSYFSKVNRDLILANLESFEGNEEEININIQSSDEITKILQSQIQTCFRKDSGEEVSPSTLANTMEVTQFTFNILGRNNISKETYQKGFEILENYWNLIPAESQKPSSASYVSLQFKNWSKFINNYKVAYQIEQNGKKTIDFEPLIDLITDPNYQDRLRDVYASPKIMKELIMPNDAEIDLKLINLIIEQGNGELLSQIYFYILQNIDKAQFEEFDKELRAILKKRCDDQNIKKINNQLLTNLDNKMSNLFKKSHLNGNILDDKEIDSLSQYFDASQNFQFSCHSSYNSNITFDDFLSFFKVNVEGSTNTKEVAQKFFKYFLPLFLKKHENVFGPYPHTELLLNLMTSDQVQDVESEFAIILKKVSKQIFSSADNNESINKILKTTQGYTYLVQENPEISVLDVLKSYPDLLESLAPENLRNLILPDLEKAGISKEAITLLVLRSKNSDELTNIITEALSGDNYKFITQAILDHDLLTILMANNSKIESFYSGKYFKSISFNFPNHNKNKLFEDLFLNNIDPIQFNNNALLCTNTNDQTYSCSDMTKDHLDIYKILKDPYKTLFYNKILPKVSLNSGTLIEIISNFKPTPAVGLKDILLKKPSFNMNRTSFLSFIDNVIDNLPSENKDIYTLEILYVIYKKWNIIESKVSYKTEVDPSGVVTQPKKIDFFNNFLNKFEEYSGFKKLNLHQKSGFDKRATDFPRGSTLALFIQRAKISESLMSTDEASTQDIHKKILELCSELNESIFGSPIQQSPESTLSAESLKNYRFGCFRDEIQKLREITYSPSPFFIVRTISNDFNPNDYVHNPPLAENINWENALIDYSPNSPEIYLKGLEGNKESLIKDVNIDLVNGKLNIEIERNFENTILYPFLFTRHYSSQRNRPRNRVALCSRWVSPKDSLLSNQDFYVKYIKEQLIDRQNISAPSINQAELFQTFYVNYNSINSLTILPYHLKKEFFIDTKFSDPSIRQNSLKNALNNSKCKDNNIKTNDIKSASFNRNVRYWITPPSGVTKLAAFNNILSSLTPNEESVFNYSNILDDIKEDTPSFDYSGGKGAAIDKEFKLFEYPQSIANLSMATDDDNTDNTETSETTTVATTTEPEDSPGLGETIINGATDLVVGAIGLIGIDLEDENDEDPDTEEETPAEEIEEETEEETEEEE